MSEQQKSRQEEYAEQIAQELIERLQQGTAPFQRLWEPSMGRDFPHNPVSGNEYSGLNVLRLMLQGRSDPRWMTYKQAASVNAQVRKGERGVGLVRLITHVERVKKDEHGKTVLDENGEPVKERHALEQPYFKGFTVFNAEQIDGLPELKQAEPVWENHERAEKLLAASGAVIRHGGNDAYYSPKRDEIVLPKKEQFAGQGEYYAVALHELGHWSGHESRLNRDLSGRFGSEAYAREELRAEIASLMLTRELGLPHNPDRHAHYVGSWVKVLSEEPIEILKATQDAGRIKGFVLGFEQQIETERNGQRTPEKHYSEKIIDSLTEQHGWTKEDGMSASKVLTGVSKGGMLNPEGRLKVHARFDETGRYLSLERGWDTLFDIDARGIQTDAASALINDYAEQLRHSNRLPERAEIEMRLHGMNVYHSAQQSPEAAAEALEVLPAPNLCTSERFAEYARVVPSDVARNWEVRWPEATEYGMNHAFSDAATPEGAVKDVHRRTVNNHLYLATGKGTKESDKSQLPPENVLAEYSELCSLYMPKSLSERFQTAKQEYEQLLAKGTDADREFGRFMDAGMEALIKGLPEQTQLQARTNFYETQISRINAKSEPEQTPEQQELFAGR